MTPMSEADVADFEKRAERGLRETVEFLEACEWNDGASEDAASDAAQGLNVIREELPLLIAEVRRLRDAVAYVGEPLRPAHQHRFFRGLSLT